MGNKCESPVRWAAVKGIFFRLLVIIKLNHEKFLNDAFKKYKSFYNNMGAAQIQVLRGPKQCKTGKLVNL